MNKVDRYIQQLKTLGDGRYHYYDGRIGGIGCSDYTRLALVRAEIIKPNETFHAASGNVGVLADTTRFQRIPWNRNSLKEGDILWSQGHHVATWDGKNGVYEAAPENSHGICENGKTGVGHWPNHTYYNCGTGAYSWTCIYRIVDIQKVKEEIKGAIMDKAFNTKTLIEFLPIIKSGSTGKFVECLQTIMQKYGWYAGYIDGSAGPMTVSGIKLLQIALGINSDGICGPKTWTKLLSD